MAASPEIQAAFVGRDNLVADVASARVPLLILHGDSGVGKSSLLRNAQSVTEDALAPAPIEVYSGDGAVQQALLDGLAAALSALLLDEPWREVRHTVVEFIQRLVAKSASEARQVVGLALIGRLKERYGESTVDVLGEVWTEARAATEGVLERRIARARSPQIARGLSSLGSELLQLSSRRTLVLAFDRAEILPPGDLRLLADIARDAPEGVILRVAVMDTGPEGASAIQLLRAGAGHSAAFLKVDPLDESGVRAFVELSGLDPAITPAVYRATGGYPMHIGDALLHIKRGGHLKDLPINRDFGFIIDLAWAELDSEARRVARQIALLERPLPLRILLDVLRLTEPAWWDITDRLQRIRVFTQVVDGIPWFHEQRRKWLLHQMSEGERASYGSVLVRAMNDAVAEPSGWRLCATFADLLEVAAEGPENERLYSVARLGNPELAVAGALLELAEPGVQGVDADAALSHARHHFGAVGSLVESLRRLDELGLAQVVERNGVAITVPLMDLQIAAAIAGCCQRRIGRMPIPRLASVIWSTAFAPLAQSFGTAAYGIGAPLAGAIVHDTHVAQMRRTGIIGPSFAGCVAYGQHRGTPIYAVASTARERVRTLADGWRIATAEIGEATFGVTDVVEYPAPRILSQRWTNVATDLVGPAPIGREDSGYSVETELVIRSKMREAIRGRISHADQVAIGLAASAHYYFSEGEHGVTEVEVRGDASGATRVDELRVEIVHDPYALLRLATALGLPADASVGHVTTGGRLDRSHPLRKVAKDLAERAMAFNREQPRVELDLAPGRLEPWLAALLEDRFEDAARVHAAVGLEIPEPTHLEVFVVTSPVPDGSIIDTPPATVAVRSAERTEVHYSLCESPIRGWGHEELLQSFSQAEGLARHGYAAVESAIAGLAGYDERDVTAFRSLRDLALLRRGR